MTVKPPIRASSTTSASHWDSSEESLERSPRVTSGAVVIAGAGGAAGETDGVAPAAGDLSGLGDGRSWMTPGATGEPKRGSRQEPGSRPPQAAARPLSLRAPRALWA